VRCSLLFYFVNTRYMTLLLLFAFLKRYAMFNGVVDSREAISSRGSSLSQSSGLTSHVSLIHLNYKRMEN
jgi:hypothetical protein